MSIDRSEVENLIERSGFVRSHETKKVVEYRSSHNGKVFYFRTEIGLPEYIRLVVHPHEEIAGLIALTGVTANSPKEFQHGSNMSRFPKKMNRGKDEIHYGRALNVSSLTALSDLASAFHKL
ncbi:hypothetical protein [Nitrosovibrio sp. Nv4]|uniref:hypothetical protein n=1 Tax=Nitrosovibrio sp. Nv4 TaxID=1945880 RepID=UPI000BD223C8|nr:hypothetical protein [Nitrosovibrio sp. Nv4]SOD42225.1 hypothetical protein SAMN06298226_2559 [Nitrosovibrio sp. Nv4]